MLYYVPVCLLSWHFYASNRLTLFMHFGELLVFLADSPGLAAPMNPSMASGEPRLSPVKKNSIISLLWNLLNHGNSKWGGIPAVQHDIVYLMSTILISLLTVCD